MNNQLFQQNLDSKKGPQPGGPYLIQMLFKEPVEIPDKEKMTAVMEKHIGSTERFYYDKKVAGFAAQEYIAEFKDGKCLVQLMVMKCDKFMGKGFDAFPMSQIWDCQEGRERIFRECKYQVVATDMLAAALPALERVSLDADSLEALAELYPTCEAFYFQNCGRLFLAEDVRSHQIGDSDRFIRFGVNVRFFNIEGTEGMLIDTAGMSTLLLPDPQYHFHDMGPNQVVNHAYNVASYILECDNPIQDGETVDDVADGRMCRETQWKCQYEDALIQPPREVLNTHMGEYAAGGRRMNGVVLLVGGMLLVAVIKLIAGRNWMALLLCAVTLFLVFGAGHHTKQAVLKIEEVKYVEFNKYANTGITPVSLRANR